MYKIEFYDDTTLESLLESFKNLKYCGIEGYVEIDGKKIYGSEPKYKEKLIDIFHSKKMLEQKQVLQNAKKTKSDVEKKTYSSVQKIANRLNLYHNEVFKYYLSITLKYIKPEYRDSIKSYYIKAYSDDNYESLRDIHLLANILSFLEYKDVFLIQEKLNLFFLNLSEKDIQKIDFILLANIEKYAINGDLIKQCFSSNVIDEDIEQAKKEMTLLIKKNR